MNKITRLAAAFVLSGLLLAAPAAQAAPALLGASANFELEVNEMELEITADDPRPKAYLYTGGQSDYYFIVWMSSNPTVATVDGDGRVTGRSAGEATITAITDRGEYAACKVTVRKESGDAASKKPALDHTTLNLVIQYNNAHPSQKLQLINTSGSFVYAYQWMSSNPEVATVDSEGLVTAQKPGTTTITALATNGQALRCAVTVNSDVGKVTLNKRDLLLRTVGSKEALTASVAVGDGTNVPITWVSSNPGVATVDASGVVTAVADGWPLRQLQHLCGPCRRQIQQRRRSGRGTQASGPLCGGPDEPAELNRKYKEESPHCIERCGAGILLIDLPAQ